MLHVTNVNGGATAGSWTITGFTTGNESSHTHGFNAHTHTLSSNGVDTDHTHSISADSTNTGTAGDHYHTDTHTHSLYTIGTYGGIVYLLTVGSYYPVTDTHEHTEHLMLHLNQQVIHLLVVIYTI